MRTLIGGVGYGNLGDLSFGPLLMDRLKVLQWPEDVELEDLSYGPLFIMHAIDERVAFARMIFIGAVRRDTTPGEIRLYRWTHALPDDDEVQARVIEAGTGVVSMENLLVVTSYFKKLPDDVVVIEIEPHSDEVGQELTPQLATAVPAVIEVLQKIVHGSGGPLEAYDYIIPDANDRPRGWTVRPYSVE